MAFDIKKIIEDILANLKGDPKMAENFTKEPVKTVESLAGVDLPDDQIQPIVDGVKAKLNLDNLGEKLGGLKNLLG